MRQGLAVLAALLATSCRSKPQPTPQITAGSAACEAPPAPPQPVVGRARRAVDERARLSALLSPIGRRILDAVPPPPEPLDPLAIGPCVRPTDAERAVLRRAIAAASPDARAASLGLALGCQDQGGIVVDVSYDRAAPGGGREGVWRVVHVAGTHVTTLAELSRRLATGPGDFAAYTNRSHVKTLALIDLDGDGTPDPVLVRNLEAGERHDVELAVWSSRRRTASPWVTVPQVVAVTVPPGQVGVPLVLRFATYDADLATAYRCIAADGTLDRCAAIDAYRHRDDVLRIARAFAAGDFRGLDPELDRELLGELLDTLAVAPVERAALVAAVEPGRPEIHMRREVNRVRAARADDRFVPAPELRPAALGALLGDAPCTPATAAATAAARAQLTRWIHDHDAQDLIDRGGCAMAMPCHAQHPTGVTIQASCVAGDHTYYTAHWGYRDDPNLLRDGLFYVANGAFTMVTGVAERHRVGPDFTIKMYRHGDTLVALTMGQQELRPDAGTTGDFDGVRRRAYAIDGVLTALPPRSRTDWYGFGMAEYGTGEPVLAADNIIAEWSDDRRAVAYWHWDGAWTQLAAFPLTLRGPAPTDEPAGRWLWQQARLTLATKLLYRLQLDFMAWQSSADVRADTAEALAIVGADPAIIARVAADAARVR